MTSEEPAHFPLLQLQDPCLVQVLQCLAADDLRALFSAARAHSRLHQAAVIALSSITAVVSTEQGIESLQEYLSKHGQHVDSIHVAPRQLGLLAVFPILALRQLPPCPKLSSLQLQYLRLQLQRGRLSSVHALPDDDACKGVLGAAAEAATLKKLQISNCDLLDDSSFGESGKVLEAALSQLSAGLEHLSISGQRPTASGQRQTFRTGSLLLLQQLTYLELSGMWMYMSGPDTTRPAPQPLEALTRLVDLRLQLDSTFTMLFVPHHLTRLDVLGGRFEPEVLAGKSQLRHLCLRERVYRKQEFVFPRLLSHLEDLQQLTHLDLGQFNEMTSFSEDSSDRISPAAYSALTASSMLQHLNIEQWDLPEGVWQHIFPAGRRLQHLQSLDVAEVRQPINRWRDAQQVDATRLVSCCPELQSLDMSYSWCSSELLAALPGLSRLHTLQFSLLPPIGWPIPDCTSDTIVEVLTQLAGLRQLSVKCRREEFPGSASTFYSFQGLLFQLTQVTQLTQLTYTGPEDTPFGLTFHSELTFSAQAPADEPVWRQVLSHSVGNQPPPLALLADLELGE